MANIILKDIKKSYSNKTTVIENLNLEIEDGSFTVLVGPSGCGKSTTLRMVAGLEDITSGELYIGDENVTKVEANKRGISMVFQNYALYPHMSVKENIEFGLKNNKVKKEERNRLISEVSSIVGLDEYLNRKPSDLSGGQRQRVALARAMVKTPKVFLMDEPLSNLDAKLRNQMRSELIQLHKRLKSTFVYVTHDQVEAMSMADKIVIMNKGKIMQQDSPKEIYKNPKNVFVAQFIGNPAMNIINIEHIGKIYGGKIVFEDASFGVQQGDKIGIVGINEAVRPFFKNMQAHSGVVRVFAYNPLHADGQYLIARSSPPAGSIAGIKAVDRLDQVHIVNNILPQVIGARLV